MTPMAAVISERFPPLTDLESVIWPGVILTAFVATAAIVDVMVLLAARWKMIDLPNRRSAHSLPTARGGGAAIILVTTMGTVLAAVKWENQAWRILVGSLLPSVLIGIVGLIDDMKPLNAKLRLVLQIVVAVWIATVLGPFQSVSIPGLPELSLGVFGWPLTVLWVVGMINAFNFIDGVDGMAGTCGLMAGLMVAAYGLVAWIPPLMVLGGLVAATTGGFLVFNWQPARIFMGDIGSAFLGTFLAAVPLLFEGDLRDRLVVPVVMGMWPVIFDPLVSVIRRAASGHNPLEPHREFFFHRLVRGGMSHARVSLLYGVLAAAGVVAGGLMFDVDMPMPVRSSMPLLVLATAGLLAWGTESWCSRRELAPPGAVEHSPSE
jgi:Fuc2NAc and GlcNAc transferase